MPPHSTESMTFESSVNPEGIQTNNGNFPVQSRFESSVNPEGIQTVHAVFYYPLCLRAV